MEALEKSLRFVRFWKRNDQRFAKALSSFTRIWYGSAGSLFHSSGRRYNRYFPRNLKSTGILLYPESERPVREAFVLHRRIMKPWISLFVGFVSVRLAVTSENKRTTIFAVKWLINAVQVMSQVFRKEGNIDTWGFVEDREITRSCRSSDEGDGIKRGCRPG